MSNLHARIEAQVGKLELELELDSGKAGLAVVGPNGAGKTTLLLLLLGALPVLRGRIEVAGVLLTDSDACVHVPIERRQLAYVPQDYALFPHLTVRENIAFALTSMATRLTPREREERVDRWLGELELAQLAERKPAKLSGGEQQRVALARALVGEPRALLLDEPLAALDVSSRRTVRSFLASYLRSLALPTIVVTHDPIEARELASRIVVVEAGKITQSGSFEQLVAAPATQFVERFVAQRESS